MLHDSQENIFRKISAVFSESSHSTNVGDFEEQLLRAMETGENFKVEESPEFSGCKLRTRKTTVKGRKKRRKCGTKSSKASKQWKQAAHFNENFMAEELHAEYSQESVSMLQDCYHRNSQNDFPDLTETCFNSELEVIDIYSDEEMEVPLEQEHIESSCRLTTVDISTQTEYSHPLSVLNCTKETEITKHAKFISSVVKLKTALSSKKTVSDKKLWDILQGADPDEESAPMEIDEPEQGQTLPKETINYLLRSSEVENVFRETIQVLLQHLEKALGDDDFLMIACCWKNSIYETVVKMLSEAVDSDTTVWKPVASFLSTSIGSILTNNHKNLTLESKANFIISFCKSTRLSYSIVNIVIKKIKKLKTIKRSSDWTEDKKLFAVNLTNKSYFLLRILEFSLQFLKTKVAEEKIVGILIKKPLQKNYNVLEMWKKHWKNESSGEQKTDHEWEMTVCGWCDVLDEILLHCLNHIPVLSMAVERCGGLSKEILKLCHFGVMEEKTVDLVYDVFLKKKTIYVVPAEILSFEYLES